MRSFVSVLDSGNVHRLLQRFSTLASLRSAVITILYTQRMVTGKKLCECPRLRKGFDKVAGQFIRLPEQFVTLALRANRLFFLHFDGDLRTSGTSPLLLEDLGRIKFMDYFGMRPSHDSSIGSGASIHPAASSGYRACSTAKSDSITMEMSSGVTLPSTADSSGVSELGAAATGSDHSAVGEVELQNLTRRIFPSRSVLLAYEDALSLYHTMEDALPEIGWANAYSSRYIYIALLIEARAYLLIRSGQLYC